MFWVYPERHQPSHLPTSLNFMEGIGIIPRLYLYSTLHRYSHTTSTLSSTHAESHRQILSTIELNTYRSKLVRGSSDKWMSEKWCSTPLEFDLSEEAEEVEKRSTLKVSIRKNFLHSTPLNSRMPMLSFILSSLNTHFNLHTILEYLVYDEMEIQKRLWGVRDS